VGQGSKDAHQPGHTMALQGGQGVEVRGSAAASKDVRVCVTDIWVLDTIKVTITGLDAAAAQVLGMPSAKVPAKVVLASPPDHLQLQACSEPADNQTRHTLLHETAGAKSMRTLDSCRTLAGAWFAPTALTTWPSNCLAGLPCAGRHPCCV
jgi:hypothetical protein